MVYSVPTIDTYQGLIPPPNLIQPKFMAWLTTQCQPLLDTINLNIAMDTAFHIDHAVGVQLDTLGVILNLSRTVNFEPSDGSSPVLDDDTYRLVLKAKIIQNQWKGTVGEIYDFWAAHFPQYVILIQDNQDMSMNVFLAGMAPGLLQDLVTHGYFVPKPAGVRINYVFAVDPIFAWDLENTYFKGWEEGRWATFS